MKSLIIPIFFSMLAFANISNADQLSEAQKKLRVISDKVSAIRAGYRQTYPKSS